ncbi:MAG: hypothetical protein R3270_03340 [Gammaproteobacteria bacterium]|nr:hypothetical protein [Gammaproteobacteria bacterium]
MNILSTARQVALALFCALALVACGGGSSGGGDTTGDSSGGGDGGNNEKPTAQIVFPPDGSLATADSLTVRGTASDDSGVNAVTVNGVAASSSDGFQTWTAVVPLAGDSVEIRVAVEDDAGESTTAADTVTILRDDLHVVYPRAVEVAASGGYIIASSGNRSLFKVDPDSGTPDLLSGATRGTGPLISHPTAISLGVDDNVVVADFHLAAVFSVDLDTGNRQLVSGNARGTGPAFGDNLRDLTVDPSSGTIYVLGTTTYNDFQVLAVDPATGNRSLVGNAMTLTGTVPTFPLSLAYDTVGDRLILSDDTNILVALDVDSGVASTLAPSVGDLPQMASSIVFDATGNRVFLYDAWSEEFFKVELDTGMSTLIGGATEGTTPQTILFGMAIDNDTLVSPLPVYRELMAIDTSTGNRDLMLADTIGNVGIGPRLSPYSVAQAADLDSGRIWAIDRDTNKLILVDTTSGERSTVATLSSGYDQLLFSATRQQLIAVNRGDIDLVDPETGDIDPLQPMPAGFTCLDTPGYGLFEAADLGQLLMTCYGEDQVVAFDIDAWSYSEFSGATMGTGVTIPDPYRIERDTDRARFLVMSRDGTLYGVDETTRDRTLLGSLPGLMSGTLLGASDITMSPDGSALIVLDGRTSRVGSVTPDTLSADIVAGHGAGSTSVYPFAGEIFVSANGEFAWVIAYSEIVKIDLVGGDHVTVSR